MLPVFLLILLFSGIILIEVPGLIRKKMWRELTVFSLILALGFSLCLGQLIGLNLPNPSRIIANILHIKY
jgi:hypothetical protein